MEEISIGIFSTLATKITNNNFGGAFVLFITDSREMTGNKRERGTKGLTDLGHWSSWLAS